MDVPFEMRLNRLQRLAGNLRQQQSVIGGSIGRQDAGAAAVGYNYQSPPFGYRLIGKQRGDIKQFFNAVDTEQASLTEQSFGDSFGSG